MDPATIGGSSPSLSSKLDRLELTGAPPFFFFFDGAEALDSDDLWDSKQ